MQENELYNQCDDNLTEEERIKKRFAEICDLLQLREELQPRLKVMAVDSRKNWHVFGQYNRRTNVLQLSNRLLEDDYLAVHELIHLVCAKELGYRGSHGVPFLALHDLVIAFHMNGADRLGNGAVIDLQWATIATSNSKKQAKEESARIVSFALSALANDGYSRDNPPGIHVLAKVVQASVGSTYRFSWKDRKTWRHSFDVAWTQRQGIFPMLIKLMAQGIVASLVACFGLAWLFTELKWQWLSTAAYGAGGVAIALFLLAMVYEFGVRIFVGLDLRATNDRQ
jgi:hypothetical protein